MNGGGGGGRCVTTIRQLDIHDDIQILECVTNVYLEESGRAKFVFDLKIQGLDNCDAHDKFFFIVPCAFEDIGGMTASDGDGLLRCDYEEVTSAGETKTQLNFHYRELMVAGEVKNLHFEFINMSNFMILSELLRKYMIYTDFMGFSVYAKKVKYLLHPPSRFIFHKKGFVNPLITDPGGINPHVKPIVFEISDLKPQAPVPISVALRSTRMPTKTTFSALLIMIVAGVIGFGVETIGEVVVSLSGSD